MMAGSAEMCKLGAMIPVLGCLRPRVDIAWLLPAIALALGAAPYGPDRPAGTTFTVNSTADEPNATAGSPVCDSTPSHVCTLRAAIMAANANPGADTVVLHAGLYHLQLGGDDETTAAGDLDITENLTVVGDGPDLTIIDGSQLTPTGRLFDINAGAVVTMSGLALQYGKAPDNGGAILVGDPALAQGAGLNLSNCRLLNNQAGPPGHGGAIYSARAENQVTINDCSIWGNSTSYGGAIDNLGSLTISNSRVTSNTVDTAGGGLENGGGTVLITSSTFSADSSFNGGGIHNTGGTLTIVGGTVSGNFGGQGAGILNDASLVMSQTTVTNNLSSDSSGGGLMNRASGVAMLSGVAFVSNTAKFLGGGLYNSGVLTLTGALIEHNTATDNGGGGLVQDGVTAWVASSAIVSNSAPSGGGIFVLSGAITLTNSTVSSNTVGGSGAGLYSHGASAVVDLANDTVAYNLAGQLFGTGGVKNDAGGTLAVQNSLIAWNAYQGLLGSPVYLADCDGNLTSDGYNLVRVDCGFTHQTGDQVGTLSTPLDPRIGPLANNGGPTLTHALLPGSPAIDRGNPAGCLDPSGTLLTTDQRGYPRPAFGGLALRCDIGAYELLLEADLSVGEHDKPDPVLLGAPLTYTVVVTNAGPAPATGVALADTLPAGADLHSVVASQGSCLGTGTVTCALGTLARGTQLTVTFVVAPTATGTIDNVAMVTADEFDPVLANNTASERTAVVRDLFLPLILRGP